MELTTESFFQRILILLRLVSLTLPLVACGDSAEGDAGASASGEASDKAHAHTNALIDENSPYLLQHAHNPVDWYPWGEAAFEKAKREDKPIFLSVGYSTCYWCHVMEKESFEDAEVAAILNEHYVAIKVDREERPDVDETYMLATQLVTGRGGWPNSLWLTPDGEPWMAGTYFPKDAFMDVLENLAEVWETRRDEVNAQAATLNERIQQISQVPAGARGTPTLEMVGTSVERVKQRFDAQHAGFGPAPKFPPHGTLRLLSAWSAHQDEALPVSVTRTLDAMWLGGMHDHIGGGFHRYATDAEWLLPHFEKMLYDNAQLMRNYAEAAARTGEPRYRQAVADIYTWLEREMTDARGGFYSAIDSGEVGKEGEFYVWTLKELEAVLGEEDAAFFGDIYGFDKRGNFKEESTGHRTGANIPHLEQPLAAIAKTRGIEPDQLRERLVGLRTKLLAARMERTYPHLDNKVLTSWNGLMIEALAYAGAKLDEPNYIEAAARAADFLLETMAPGNTLLRSYRAGTASQAAFLDDYAYLGAGLLQLHAATGEARWLEAAQPLADALMADFQDEARGGFFLARNSADSVLARSKALQGGGNLPSANGVAAQMLIELERRTGEAHYGAAAQATLESLAGMAAISPFAQEHVLLAVLQSLQPAAVATSLGEPESVRQAQDSKQAPTLQNSQSSQPEAAGKSLRKDPVTYTLKTGRSQYRPGESGRLTIELAVDEGWHLYGKNPELDFLVPVSVEPVNVPQLKFGSLKAPEPKEKIDPILEETVRTYEGTVVFELPFTVRENAQSGPALLAVKLRTQACDAERCFAPEELTLRLPVEIQ